MKNILVTPIELNELELQQIVGGLAAPQCTTNTKTQGVIAGFCFTGGLFNLGVGAACGVYYSYCYLVS